VPEISIFDKSKNSFVYSSLPNIYDIKDEVKVVDEKKSNIPSVTIEKDGKIIEKKIEKIIEKSNVEKIDNHDNKNVSKIERENSGNNVLPITDAISNGKSGKIKNSDDSIEDKAK
jgi:hypothetical protein